MKTRKVGLNIYIASFFDTRERLKSIVERLHDMGHTVTSTWLTEPSNVNYTNVTEGYRMCCALRDRYDIRHSHIVVLDTIDETPRGGREWEGGICSTEGIPFVIVGPFRNVFHRQCLRHFTEWEEALQFFKEIRIE